LLKLNEVGVAVDENFDIKLRAVIGAPGAGWRSIFKK